MLAFRALLLLTLLLPSLPNLGDAIRAQVQAHVGFNGMIGREMGAWTCGSSMPQILEENPWISQIILEENRSPSDDPEEKFLDQITYDSLLYRISNKIATSIVRPSVPTKEFSLSFRTQESTHKLLEKGPSDKFAGFQSEWLLFAGGYTILIPGITHSCGDGCAVTKGGLWGATRGSRGCAFTLGAPIFNIPSSRDRTIAYTIYRPRTVRKILKVIVWCHGNAVNIELLHLDTRRMAEMLSAIVVGFEYPGYGDPNTKTDIPKMTRGYSTVENVKFVTLAGVNWIRQVWGVDEKDIIIAGQSIGTGVAAEVAWQYERQRDVQSLGGLILISPYASIRELIVHHIHSFVKQNDIVGMISKSATQSNLDNTTFNTLNHLREMADTPVYAVHSPDDMVIPFEHFQRLQEENGLGYPPENMVFVRLTEGLGSPIDPKGTRFDGHNYPANQLNGFFEMRTFHDWVRRNIYEGAHNEWLRDIHLHIATEKNEQDIVLELVLPRVRSRNATGRNATSRAACCGRKANDSCVVT